MYMIRVNFYMTFTENSTCRRPDRITFNRTTHY